MTHHLFLGFALSSAHIFQVQVAQTTVEDSGRARNIHRREAGAFLLQEARSERAVRNDTDAGKLYAH